jgi:hypothetical protein
MLHADDLNAQIKLFAATTLKGKVKMDVPDVLRGWTDW